MLNYIITNKINEKDLKIFQEFVSLLKVENADKILENNLCIILFFEKENDFYAITTLSKPICGTSNINNLLFTNTKNSKSITFSILQTIQIGLFRLKMCKINLTLPKKQTPIIQHCNMLGFKAKELGEEYKLQIETLSHYARNLIEKYNLKC